MIIDVQNGEKVNIRIRELAKEDVKKIHDSREWIMPFYHSYTKGNQVFALVTVEEPDAYQGLIALSENHDSDFLCVDLDIIESANHNKKEYPPGVLNKHRRYSGVGINLIAFACQYSIDCNLEGFVLLTSKSSKYELYEKLGAVHLFGQQMMFNSETGKRIAKTYLPGGVPW